MTYILLNKISRWLPFVAPSLAIFPVHTSSRLVKLGKIVVVDRLLSTDTPGITGHGCDDSVTPDGPSASGVDGC
jgi:hypothetical protein